MALPNQQTVGYPSVKLDVVGDGGIESLLLRKKDSTIKENNKRCKDEEMKPKLAPLIAPVPKSRVLGKVKDFLGVMASANEKLQLDVLEKSQDQFDIEALTGNEPEYIEMDLLLGVADLKTPEALAAAESTMTSFQAPRDSTSSSCSDVESSEGDEIADPKTSKRPKIVVLD